MTFFGELKEEWSKAKESPYWMCIAMILLALLCLSASVLIIPGISEKFLAPAVNVLTSLGEYSASILGTGVAP